mgnify:CR=1 FL=1
MSFKKAEKQETNVYVIEFQIDKADFDAANDKAFRKNAKNRKNLLKLLAVLAFLILFAAVLK